MMQVCAEMKKLRKLLDKKRIAWIDKSDDFEKRNPEFWIVRTHFEYKGKKWSAINGFGTYGGWNGANFPRMEEKDNMGLIELMAMNEGEPKGWLTAEDVIKEIEK